MKIDPRTVEAGLKAEANENVHNRMLKGTIMGQILAHNNFQTQVDTSDVAARNVRHTMQELLTGRITDEEA